MISSFLDCSTMTMEKIKDPIFPRYNKGVKFLHEHIEELEKEFYGN